MMTARRRLLLPVVVASLFAASALAYADADPPDIAAPDIAAEVSSDGSSEVAAEVASEAIAAPATLPAAVPLRPARPGEREKLLRLGYDVYVGGLNIFAFTIDFALNGDTYSIKGDGESRGFARMFWRWSSHLAAGGNVEPETVRPQIYNVETRSSKRDRSMQLSFDEGGKYTIRRTPPDTPHRAAKRELPPVVPKGTLDPLTISLRIARDVESGRGCKGTHAIFDGDRRYNLVFTDLGKSQLPATPYSVFAGTAHRCQFDMVRISGFREPREFLRYWDEDNLDPPEIWVAPIVPGMPPVPVRAHGDLNMGGLRVYLVWAEYGGKPLYPNGVRPEFRFVRNR